MSRIIDVDAHFEPGADWLNPYPKLAAKLPPLDAGLMAVHTICGDLLREMPADKRPAMADLLPPGLLTLFAQEKEGEKARAAEFEGKNQFEVANVKSRLKWLDEQGIDMQNVICLAGVIYDTFLDDPDLRKEVVSTANTWLAETCAEGEGRLLPVAALTYFDLDWAVRELTRMRALGSRIFLVPGYPVGDVAPVHPSWDKLWAAAEDLGMIPMLHTGFEHSRFFPGWANLGGDVTLLRQFGSSFRHFSPMTLVNGMIYSGVFERHPKLTLLMAEVGTGWLPFVYRDIDDRITPTASLFLGDWKYPLKPSEYLARHVKATPLSGGNDQPLMRIIDDLPEDMIVFSSDFPHFEGFADPKTHYQSVFADQAAGKKARFMGGAINDAYKRMGDALF